MFPSVTHFSVSPFPKSDIFSKCDPFLCPILYTHVNTNTEIKFVNLPIMQSLINKWSVMSRRVGQTNSDQSHVKSQRATHVCLIRVPNKSVTRLISTSHKWNRTRDSRTLECGFCKNILLVLFHQCNDWYSTTRIHIRTNIFSNYFFTL